MKPTGLLFIVLLFFITSAAAQKIDQLVKQPDVERIIKVLSADDMRGRAAFTPDIERAATFIENEFKSAGLQPLIGEKTFRQSFMMTRIRPQSAEVFIDGTVLDQEQVIIVSDSARLNWNEASNVEVIKIGKGETFVKRYREILKSKKPTLVLVNEDYTDAFKRLHDYSLAGRMVQEPNSSTNVVFVLDVNEVKSFRVRTLNKIENLPLFNVVGMLPGKSKPNEVVIFSAHYDHIGIIDAARGDSIANGADDNASGTTAVIMLAKHFKKANNNERTLLFVAFTAEEIGGFGSQYFSSQLYPDDVIAMFNIEMIGKNSRFGKNTAFITGYEKSDFGNILQKNLEGTGFRFYPDPYPEQKLFYRSDNATLAALGVPAHTISTDEIDIDKYYHTVDDEFETLDVTNITATIKAIALSAKSIINATDTPKRIPKL